jgi:hypothetical protein
MKHCRGARVVFGAGLILGCGFERGVELDLGPGRPWEIVASAPQAFTP